MPAIVFPLENVLLHSLDESVTIWDVANRQVRARCPGSLASMARDGRTFRTAVGRWDTETGIQRDDADKGTISDYTLRIVKVQGDRSTLQPTWYVQNWYVQVFQSGEESQPRLSIRVLEEKVDFVRDMTASIDPSLQYIIVQIPHFMNAEFADILFFYDFNSGEEITSCGWDKISSYSLSAIHHFVIIQYYDDQYVHHLLTGRRQAQLEKRYLDLSTIRVSPKNLPHEWTDAVRLGYWGADYDPTWPTPPLAAALNMAHTRLSWGDLSWGGLKKSISRSKVKFDDIAFDPSGDRLAASLSNDEIHIWDVETAKVIAKLRD